MTFARTWIKVPFMRFGRSITDKDGPTTTASTRALASGPEQPACHGPLMFNETSTLENARGGSAPPSESRTALDPPRSQLPALASNVTADGPAALPLMPPVLSPPPSRLLQGRVPGRGPTRLTAWPPLSRGAHSPLVEALSQLATPSPT
jgi:hypothetical protein